MGSLLISIIIAGFLAYSVLALTIYFMQPTFLYRPMRGILYTPAELGLDFDDVIFTSGDGVQLNGWYIPAEGSGMTVLFCHGNGGNMTHRLDSISIFNDLGLNCFIFDYRGYGNSEGEPSEEGTYMDAAAAYKWLREEKKQSAEDIIIFGRSLGGSIAAKLASSVKAKSLILESCFTSYVAIGAKFYPYMPVKWFARYNYNTVEYIQDVRCPVMVIHSRSDELVPFEFGVELYEAANEPSKFVEIYGMHNDGFLVSRQIYKKAWADWLEFLKRREGQSTQQQAL